MATSGYKSVSRIDHRKRHTHGWYVRVKFNGIMYSRFFSDSQCGGKRRALKEAVQCRNELEKEVGKPRTDRVVPALIARNQTGVPGVRLGKKRSQRKGPRLSRVYEVVWAPEPGKLSRTSVSIEKYGAKEALRRALAIRLEKEREIYGAVLSRTVKLRFRVPDKFR